MQTVGQKHLRVLHLDTELGWRGGEQQIDGLVTILREEYGCESRIICRPGSALERRFRPQKIALPLKMFGELDLFAAWRIVGHIRNFCPDVLHAHTGHAHTLALFAAYFARLVYGLRIPVVISRRVNFPIRNNFASRWKYRSKLATYIAVSEAVRHSLVSFGIDKSRVYVVHSGADLARFREAKGAPISKEIKDILQNAGVREDSFVLISSCALAPMKDVPTLLRAISLVSERIPTTDFRLIIAGTGEQHDEFVTLCTTLGLSEKVYFAGFVEDVPGLLARGNMFVLSTLSEGIGSSILEAIAAGLPVVATDVDGVPEIITDGKNGYLVPPGDIEALANAISILYTDPAGARALAAEAKKIFDTNFTIHSMSEGNYRVYEQILNASAAPQR